jgi:hypothetical protein
MMVVEDVIITEEVLVVWWKKFSSKKRKEAALEEGSGDMIRSDRSAPREGFHVEVHPRRWFWSSAL